MMNIIIRSFFILVFGLNIYAQTGAETLPLEVSKTDIIKTDRNLLLDKVLEADVDGMEYYRNSLLDKEDKNYASFHLIEKLLFNYWLKEYQDIKVDVKTYKLKQSVGDTKIYPQSDYLFPKLVEKTKENRLALINNIKNSNESELDKAFLILNLDFLIVGDDQSEINQDYLNTSANQFLSNNPESVYDEFTRNYIRYEFTPSKWGYGFEFFTGYGMFTNELSDSFSNNVAIGVAFDVAYKKSTFYLRDYIGIGKTNDDIAVLNSGDIWEKGSRANTIKLEVLYGYDIYENKKIKWTPFIGVSGINLSPTENDIDENSSLKDAGIDFVGTCDIGLNFDWKISNNTAGLVMNQMNSSYWFLRVRYNYAFGNFELNNTSLNGNFHYITIGFGGFGRSLKRVK